MTPQWSEWGACTKNRSRTEISCLASSQVPDSCPLELEKEECTSTSPGNSFERHWKTFEKSYWNISANPAVWQEWGSWSQCISSCGPGAKIRARACSGDQIHGSNGQCLGNSTEVEDCVSTECPGIPMGIIKYCRNICSIIKSNNLAAIPAEWESWGQWSHCSTSCGNGSRVRGRGCSEPAFGGNDQCPGNSTEVEDCVSAECPGFTSFNYHL